MTFSQPCSRMTKEITFSRQNDAGSRARNLVLVDVFVLKSKGL